MSFELEAEGKRRKCARLLPARCRAATGGSDGKEGVRARAPGPARGRPGARGIVRTNPAGAGWGSRAGSSHDFSTGIHSAVAHHCTRGASNGVESRGSAGNDEGAPRRSRGCRGALDTGNECGYRSSGAQGCRVALDTGNECGYRSSGARSCRDDLDTGTTGAGIGTAGREGIDVDPLEGPLRGGSSRTETMPRRVVEDEAAAMLSILAPGAGIRAAGREGTAGLP